MNAWRRQLDRTLGEWALFRKFGLTCCDVVDMMPRSQSGFVSAVLKALVEKEYDKVSSIDRYSMFFDADLSDEARRVELRRLLDIGVKLLTLTAVTEDSSKVDRSLLLKRINETAREEFLSRVSRSSQLSALTLALVYPVEQVAELSDEEITQALGAVEVASYFITWDALLMMSTKDIDTGLIGMLLS